jgi:hypothetical protein
MPPRSHVRPPEVLSHSQPQICGFCQSTILRSKLSWDYHHASYKALARSADTHCVFCSLLHEDIQNLKSHVAQRFKFQSGGNVDQLTRWVFKNVHTKTPLKSGDSTLATLNGSGEERKGALYRWSVRSLGKTRDSRLMIAITFRTVPDTLGAVPDTIHLPERVFYCFPEKELGTVLEKGELGDTTDPEKSDGLQIKRWMKKCDEEHKYCPGRSARRSEFVPTRLLAIGPKGSTDAIKVVETKPNKIRGPYVTLSHCWGKPDLAPNWKYVWCQNALGLIAKTMQAFYVDTKHLGWVSEFVEKQLGVTPLVRLDRVDSLLPTNKKRFMGEGVPWDYLCSSFQHAIEVARFMGIQYMWIDSLCIIQDGVDFLKEGALMHKVYRHSYCNIAATDAANGAGGLFRERKPYEALPTRFEGDGSSPMFGTKVWRVVRDDLWVEGLLKMPLYTRGWVFQGQSGSHDEVEMRC